MRSSLSLRLIFRAAAAASLLFQAGCFSSAPTRYFVLEAPAASGTAQPSGERPVCGKDGVGILPVELPEYLSRSEIVTRVGAGEMSLSSNARWAEPLADGVARIIAETLARSLPDCHVFVLPSDYRSSGTEIVAVRLQQFERFQGEVRINASWSIDRSGDSKFHRSGSESVAQQCGSQDPADTVSCMAEALVRLTEKAAGSIQAPSA